MKQESKTYNIYCDESSYLENDLHQYMLLGSITCPYPLVEKYNKDILSMMDHYNFFAELKWSNVSLSKIEFYLEIINWFWKNTELNFRTIVIDKTQLKHNLFLQSHDEFYYKMYYYLLNYNIDPKNNYNVYLDIKDNRSANKVNKLQEILNTQYGVFRNIQNIRSHEVKLVQLTDFLMGAIAYANNFPEMKNKGKKTIVSHIKKNLLKEDKAKRISNALSESNWNNKFNLFFINLK